MQISFELQKRVERISLAQFGRPFEHYASYNGRLTRAAGRFLPETLNLDFSTKLFALYDEATQDEVIKHELTHYHLYRQHRGYRHGDADFKALLAKVGGTRHAPRPAGYGKPRDADPMYYVYACTRCHTSYPRKRRFNTGRYVCSRCQGKLAFKTVLPQSELLRQGILHY